MKKQQPILLLLAVALLAFSCKKDSRAIDTKPEAKTYQVSFSVAGGNSLKTGSAGKLQVNDAAPTLASQFAVLVYNIFDASGNQVRQLTQQSTNANFGTIKDSLGSGTYRITVAAGQANMFEKTVLLSLSPSGNITYCAYPDQTGTSLGAFSDTFYKDTTFTVANAPLNQSLPIKRINGLLEIKINDALPATADHFTYTFDNEYLAFNLLKGQPIAPADYLNYTPQVTATTKIPASAAGTAGFTIDQVILNTTGTHTVTLSCYDAQSNLIESKTINNVTIKVNTKTILYGNLFGAASQSSVSLPSGWGSTTTTGF